MVEDFDKMLAGSLRLGAPWYTSKSIVILLFLPGKISLNYPTERFGAKWPKKNQKNFLLCFREEQRQSF